MSKHTKGPWLAGAPVVYSDEDGEETVYQITVYSPKPREFGVAELVGPKAEIVPNAHLIAAAPDFVNAAQEALAALYGAREVLGSIGNTQHAIDLLEAAIAKAKGEA